MTSEESAFRQAILANPADDTVRLVFADWLDEHKRPEWAELIRLQCLLAGRDSQDLSMSAPVGYARMWALLEQKAVVDSLTDGWGSGMLVHFQPGFGEAYRQVSDSGVVLEVERGLVVRCCCPGSWWVDSGDELLAQHPIESVLLHDPPWPPLDGTTSSSTREEIVETLRLRWPTVRTWEWAGGDE